MDALTRAALRLRGRRLGLFGKTAPAPAATRVGSLSFAALGIILTAAEMTSIHTFQHIYFNRFVDRETPEYLRSQYDMSYWGISNLQGLQFLADSIRTGV